MIAWSTVLRALGWVCVGLCAAFAVNLLVGAIGGLLDPWVEDGPLRRIVGGALGASMATAFLFVMVLPAGVIGVAVSWLFLARFIPVLERDRRTTVTILSLLSLILALAIYVALPAMPPFYIVAMLSWACIAAPRLVIR